MRRIVLLVSIALLVSCAGAASPPPEDPRLAKLEARVHVLEAANADREGIDTWIRGIKAQVDAQQAAEEDGQLDPDARFAVPVGDSPTDGPTDAAVTIVEAFDFACPYCRRMAPILDALPAKYPGKVRVVYKHLVIHGNTVTLAHLASCAAGKQGKFAEYRRALWLRYDAYAASHDASEFAEGHLIDEASKLKLDKKRFVADLHGEACKAALAADSDMFDTFNVHSTPTLFINGKAVAGALDEDALRAIIASEMAVVVASGVPPAKYYDAEVMTKGEKKFKPVGHRAK